MLILALSGMRREELCMLRIRDCDADAFNIRAAKTRAGIRRVPIHPDLMDVVAKRTAGKPLDAFLIHELGPEPAKGSLRGRGAPLTCEPACNFDPCSGVIGLEF
jgi:integrase